MKWLKYFVVVVFGVLLVACGTKQAEPKVQKAIDIAVQTQNEHRTETDNLYVFQNEASFVVYQDAVYYYVLINQPQSEKAKDAFVSLVRMRAVDYGQADYTIKEGDITYTLNQSSVKEIYRSEKGN